MRTALAALAALAALSLLAIAGALSPPVLAGDEPDDPLAGAKRLFHLRDFDEAETALLTRLVSEPGDVEAFRLLADLCIRTERPADAVALVQKALALAPEDPMLHAGLWEAELALGGWEAEARAALEGRVTAFLGDEPAAAPLWKLTAAYAGYNLLNAKEQKARLREVLLAREDETPPEVLESDLFEAVIVERDVGKRVALIHQFTKLFPGSDQVNYVREILFYTLRDDLPRVIEEADAVLAEDPENRRVRAALARWLLEAGEPDASRAFEESRKAVETEPKEIDRPAMMSDEDWARWNGRQQGRYLSYAGRALHLLGRVGEALAWFGRAAKELSHDVKLYLWLGEAAEAAGESDRAIDAYARSLQSGESPEAEARLRALLPGDGTLRDKLSARLGPSSRFTDATGAMGLGGVKTGRVALGDVNDDGWPDLLLDGPRLYINRGGTSFVKSEALAGIKGGRGGLIADMDNDGRLDLVILRSEHPLVLRGDGKGGFTDVTPDRMKIDGRVYTEGAAVIDVDGDGLLDLYLANYERPPTPPWARGTPDLLFMNLGKFRFENASDRVEGVSREPMCGRGCATLDFDDDGDVDLYVANYRLDPDFLLTNRRKDGLVNEARRRGVEGECDEGYFGHGIGPVAGDLNGDGHLDLVVGNLAHPRYIGFSDVTRVFLSSGPPDYSFTDVFRKSGIRYEETHSNASLADVDLDGDLDLFLTSIYVGRKSFLYLNDGAARFTDVTWLAGVRTDNGWGSAFGDIDLDGDVDLVVGSNSGMVVYRNEGPVGGYLGLTLVGGEGTNGTAIGARVSLTGGSSPQVREISGGTGTACQDDPSIRFGVGDSKGPFTVTVRWPSGTVQRVLGVRPGAIYRLVEGGNLEKRR